jgi:hypothetical protein
VRLAWEQLPDARPLLPSRESDSPPAGCATLAPRPFRASQESSLKRLLPRRSRSATLRGERDAEAKQDRAQAEAASTRPRKDSRTSRLLSLFGDELGSLPLALRALVISGVLVALMVNLVMPVLNAAIARWARPSPRTRVPADGAGVGSWKGVIERHPVGLGSFPEDR